MEATRQQAASSFGGQLEVVPSTTLHGRSLTLVRLGWVFTLLLSAVIVVASQAVTIQDNLIASMTAMAGEVDITLYRAFASNEVLSNTTLHIIALGQLVAFVGVGLLIFWRRSDDWLAVLTSAMLITTGAGFAPATFFLPIVRPNWWLPVTLLQIILFSLLVAFLFLFPSGRFVPRWGRLVALGWILYAISWLAFPELNPHQTPYPLALFFFIGVVMVGTAAQIYRYRKVSNPDERQQSKWVMVGFVTTNLCLFILVSSSVIGLLPRLQDLAPLPVELLAIVLGLSSILIPVTIGFAIFRYRLWGIDLFINRAVVYGGLTALIVGLYIVVVGGLGALFQSDNSLVLSMLATGLIAVLFNPVRQRLQQAVNRLMYGDRDDPFTVVARLGRRMEDSAAPGDTLPLLVETIADALRLPYVGLATHSSASKHIVAETGTRPGKVQRIPLVYQSEAVGELLAAPRSPNEPFNGSELKLLNSIAQQAGAAVYATQLNVSLRRSRQQLVLAQEEERRRLQRDLHDGLGPQLATLSMRLEVAQKLVAEDPAAATALLEELKGESQSAISGIRRLVYDLRPPVLEQLGLEQAICEYTKTHSTAGGPRLLVDVDDKLPPLPAAVETASFRIITESVTNCLRHAGASTCRISIRFDEGLLLRISDNGCGLPDPVLPGVGLTSIRERTAELGGHVSFQHPDEGGTVVEVFLPVAGQAGQAGQTTS